MRLPIPHFTSAVSKIIFVLLFPCCSIIATNINCSDIDSSQPYKQWFMGPILTPNPTTVLPGHPGLELDLIASKEYGFYDSKGRLKTTPDLWGIRPLFDFQVGFNKVLGAELIGSMITNFRQGKSSTHLADTIFRLGFQIATDKDDSFIPDFRILIQETFPTGNYQKLSPQKMGTDSTGQGSFQTGIQFVFQKAFLAKKSHPFRLRASIGYFVPSAVAVKGLNCFGGDSRTKGTVCLGKYYSGFLYGEWALSRRWAVACEFNYLEGEKGRFTRKSGMEITIPSFRQLSFLPEIQHTYTENVGIIVGGWFTVSGKNSPAFGKVFGSALFIF